MKTLAKRRAASKRGRSRFVPDWVEVQKDSLRVLQLAALTKFPWLVHGFSTRPGGVSELEGKLVLNLGFTDWDSGENVLENRRRLQSALGAPDMALVSLRQFHSDVVCLFDKAPAEVCRGDASATNRPGLLLGVQTADCVPILLVDPCRHSVAAVHAGWRGTLQRIVQKTIGRMQMEFGSRSADLIATLGPAIGGCCYEVGTEVASAFAAQFANAAEWFDELRTGDAPNPLQWLSMAPPGRQPPPKNVLLDLRKANRWQLLDAGVREENISVSDLCTACHTDFFFSYRKEGPHSGRLMAVIGLRESLGYSEH